MLALEISIEFEFFSQEALGFGYGLGQSSHSLEALELHTVSSETHVSLSTSTFTTVSDGNEEFLCSCISCHRSKMDYKIGGVHLILLFVCVVGFVWRFGDHDANRYSLVHWEALK